MLRLVIENVKIANSELEIDDVTKSVSLMKSKKSNFENCLDFVTMNKNKVLYVLMKKDGDFEEFKLKNILNPMVIYNVCSAKKLTKHNM